ncbi:glucan biosynthesis protein [Caulobacter sp. KR2-114]|uniref:glucan biosynthesis protein n=1 Tax=Caulobacter sp. KR2-114 TaxID=3400912 RepID=UPI003C015F39
MTSRRDLLAALAAVGLLPDTVLAQIALPRLGPAVPFSWAGLQARAIALSARPWQPPPAPPAALQAIDYDAAGALAYRPGATVWPGRTGGVRFFHQNRYARDAVAVHLVDGDQARAVLYDEALFERPAGVTVPNLGPQAGFSGFRLLSPGGRSDWLAFTGASYFRAAGALDQYGLSARGLALNTGQPTPEEFPRFTAFWLERGPGEAWTVYALLDSPSAAGAWRFVNRKTARGVFQDVSLTVRLRADVASLGFAPLTSMFWYGEGNRRQAADWRPEIHDSDGLAIWNGRGERLWRPLNNPPRPITNSFEDRGPRGFGLLQRDRAFDHYQDDGVFYERRPSLWVEPVGDWGPGAVTLYEMPTAGETDDNIVAWWRPAGPARAGDRHDLAYRLNWVADEPAPSALARVVDTWTGQAGRPGLPPVAGATKLVVDFQGPRLAPLTRASGVKPACSAARGRILSMDAYPVVGQPGRWRLTVDIAPEGGGPVDFRGELRLNSDSLTETCLSQLL